MPDSWGSPSPGPSPNYPDAFYDEPIPEDLREALYEDDGEGDESRLVRSASLGKRGKALLVTTTSPLASSSKAQEAGVSAAAPTTAAALPAHRPGPSPVQGAGPFKDGTGYVEGSSSSSGTVPLVKSGGGGAAVTPELIMNAFDAATSTDPSDPGRRSSMTSPLPGSLAFSRLSAVRRPPRLDMDAVKKNDTRNSLTSLPDLIWRATRLAASLERGRRPTSQLDDLDFSPQPYGGRDGEKELSGRPILLSPAFCLSAVITRMLTCYVVDNDRHQSGLSDMLAAFPPPAHDGNRRSLRQSLRDQLASWPLPLTGGSGNGRGGPGSPQGQQAPGGGAPGSREGYESSEATDLKQSRRRCCGLPLWGFITVVIIVLILVAAAIVIPLEFFVIRKQNLEAAQSALVQCRSSLACANGGSNVVSDGGFCSCVCTNGFTGFDCTVAGADGCVTTDLSQGQGQGQDQGGGSLDNVTLGDAVPRLILAAQTNFSIALSATEILGKFNSGNLSCAAENALITFDGEKQRIGDADSEVRDFPSAGAVNNAAILTVTVIAGSDTTIVLNPVTTITADASSAAASPAAASPAAAATANDGDGGGFSTIVSAPTAFSSAFQTTVSFSTKVPVPTSTTTMTMRPSGTRPLGPGATFTVTEEVIDFARVVVLLILQAENLINAETAQNQLQRFFQDASQGSLLLGQGVTVGEARNLTLDNGNSVNLVEYQVDVGTGPQGGLASSLVPFQTTTSTDSSDTTSSSARRQSPVHVRRHPTPFNAWP